MNLSIVVPVYGNEQSLEELYTRIVQAAEKVSDVNLTIQFVNDSSPDNSQSVLEDLARRDPRVRVAVLSRNFGSFNAILAGFSQVCESEAVIVLSADLQDPPELIPEMVACWRAGKRVVLCTRRTRSDPLTSRMFSKVYYWLYRKLVLRDMPENGFDFFLIDKKVVRFILDAEEKRTSLIGLILWAGFERAYIPYDRVKRKHGRSMWSFRKKLLYAIDSIVAFSSAPLRIFSFFGVLLGGLCVAGIFFALISYFNNSVQVSGWMSLFLVLLFIGSGLFLAIGVLGEYFMSAFDQLRNRPSFLIGHTIAATGQSACDKVPLFDLERVSELSQHRLESACVNVLHSKQIILGPEVSAFEHEFAASMGSHYAVGVASGTDAIILALWGVGIQPGDRVIIPAISAPATAVAVLRAGAVPVITDVEPETLTLCPEAVAKALAMGPAKVIMPVHLYGNPCRLEELSALAQKHGATLLEDCAQSAGSHHQGRFCGTWGKAGAFSFYPTKNLGAYGDGGAVLTDDEGLAQELKSMRFYGQDSSGECVRIGINSRLDEMQAALLRQRLKDLPAQNTQRRELAAFYDLNLPELSPVLTRSGRVAHLFVLRPQNREAFRSFLSEQGIITGIHYQLPLNQHRYIAANAVLTPCPVAELACTQVVSLPCYPGLHASEATRVVAACRQYLANGGL